jgi:hypothetical protein
MSPKDLAISLIKDYVLRGDSLDSLRRSYMGMGWTGYNVGIANGGKIIVSEIEGKECNYIFDLKTLFDEIKSGQMKLL